mgnify:CR=1 FL=1
MAMLIKRLCNLITIKSLVTLLLTIMFNILAYRGDIDSVVFVSVYNLVIGFYFGTQKTKDDSNKNSDS